MATRELEGRNALVTGGAKGIGRACCELLAAEGANVAINYLTSEQAAEALGISRATAARYWNYARTWLYVAISGEDPSSDE